VGIGTIEGRVSNARTGEFMERARVTVEGTALETFTDSAGQFRLTLVPSGVAKIRVFFTGQESQIGFVPKSRTRHHRGRVRSFPRDDASKPIHLTAFVGYKAGMTHVVKYQERREGKKVIKKDIVHACTVLECPPMKIVGLVGYIETPRGLRALQTVWAAQLDNDVKRRFYKNWMNAKKKAFSKYADRHKLDAKDKNSIQRDLARIKKYCTVVRVLAATQIRKIKQRQHKA